MNRELVKKGLFLAGGWLAASVLTTTIHKKKARKHALKGVALTFDDGPHPIYTVRLLDILHKYNVKATFFVVGENAEKYPEIIKRMQEDGHRIGIHHYRHTSNWLMSPQKAKKEIERCADRIQSITGNRPILYRPPWGHMTPLTQLVAKKYHITLWTKHFTDWKVLKIKDTLTDDLLTATKEGSVFLLHDNGQTIGADRQAPHYMLHHLESYLRQAVQHTHFVVLE